MASKEKKTSEREGGDSEMIRRFRQNPLVFVGTLVILIIVIVAFVLVPAFVPEYGMGGNVDLTFGYYDKVPISYVPGNRFAQYYNEIAYSRQSTMNSDISIWYEAYVAATVHTAVLQEMKIAGYKAPEAVVNREVAKLPVFQENGRFSTALYRRMDDNQRLSLWRQVQEDTVKNHFFSDVTKLSISDAEADFIGHMALIERSFEMAVFSVDAYPDEEYEAYAEETPDLFRSIHLSVITVSSSEREAQRILDSIKSGETTFEDAARTHSSGLYAERGGDMGIKMAHELAIDIPDEAARESVIALAQGEYSDIIRAFENWSFFRVVETVQEADTSDPATLEKVRSYMRNFQRGRMENWATAQANDFRALVNEIGFAAALRQWGIEGRSFGPIPINYGGVDLFATLASQSVREISASTENENFWRVAFSTPIESPSVPVVQGANVLVLFPTAETRAEADSIAGIVSTYSSFWLNYMTTRSLQQHIMNSPKMDDRFEATFRSLMGE